MKKRILSGIDPLISQLLDDVFETVSWIHALRSGKHVCTTAASGGDTRKQPGQLRHFI